MAVAAGAAYRAVRRRGRSPADGDPAAELRRKLDESRAIVEERDEFESAETPVDRAVEERRREVHDEARAAIDEMRGRPSNGQ
jgi:hypothetical protein